MTASHDPNDTAHHISQPGLLQQESDRCLNYYSDLLPDIEPRPRRLTVRWGLHSLVAKNKRQVGISFGRSPRHDRQAPLPPGVLLRDGSGAAAAV